MKIAQHSVSMQSEHASDSLRARQTHLRVWQGNQRPTAPPGASVSISAKAMAMERAAAKSEVSEADSAVVREPRLLMLMEMVERITGRAVKVFNARDLQPTSGDASAVQAPPAQAAQTEAAPNAQPAGWGLEADTRVVIAESETMRFSAQGMVRTADGLEISFSLELEMSRSFVLETSESVRLGDAARKDPLVINFQGQGVELSSTRFEFDLNADGQTENIAQLGSGSGFLVLDRNADGKVNDGTELFGARSGDGFADLALLDSDANQWIDEADPAFQQLQVWRQDATGADALMSLQQAGVGALFLGRVATPFTVKADIENTLGQVRSTGLYLDVQGRAGSLQQVDL